MARRHSNSASSTAINQGARLLGGKHWLAGLLLVAVGAGIYFMQGAGGEVAPAGGHAPSVARHAENQPTSGRISYCFDGDSFKMQTTMGEQEVRLYGVDAPEHGQPYGAEARALAKKTWEGHEVEVVSDHGVDLYGRRVLEMRLKDGPVIQRLLLDSGCAWYYARYAKGRDDFADAEQAARQAKRGLWAEKNPTPPWEWRKAHRK